MFTSRKVQCILLRLLCISKHILTHKDLYDTLPIIVIIAVSHRSTYSTLGSHVAPKHWCDYAAIWYTCPSFSRSIHSMSLNGVWSSGEWSAPTKHLLLMHHVSAMLLAAVTAIMPLCRCKGMHPVLENPSAHQVQTIKELWMCFCFLRAVRSPFGVLSPVKGKCHQRASWSSG